MEKTKNSSVFHSMQYTVLAGSDSITDRRIFLLSDKPTILRQGREGVARMGFPLLNSREQSHAWHIPLYSERGLPVGDFF